MPHLSPDTWAAKEGILEPGQRIDLRTAWRQTWAYGKDGYHRLREIRLRPPVAPATADTGGESG